MNDLLIFLIYISKSMMFLWHSGLDKIVIKVLIAEGNVKAPANPNQKHCIFARVHNSVHR